ncbi:BAG family molecular chaperone regulator 4 [Austrofundulus limnaeus]|uniref:BAG family molecular chaperone regulator 4 n=1 Tax=Austrofundulus limnaeus TaxID=52670 RepID=A0A2I4B4M1_AUSLI|nr:PREDICTED: BAG family molecular chaperone regulator 4 [Austrofundulus limnaeus]
MHSNHKPGWPSTCNSENNHGNWNNTMDAPQYPGYPSHYWYPQSHSAEHYANTYPSGSDVQPPYNPQLMPGGYPNGHGVYNHAQNQYSTSGFHPSNPFYCADPPRSSYPNQGCPAEQSGGPSGQAHTQHQHHHYPGPHCQGGPGYPSGPYSHYSEGGHAVPPNPPYPTGQPLHPSSQAEAWGHTGPYAPPQQQWQHGQQPPQNHFATTVRPTHPPAWPGTGTGAPPPYQPKDPQHQRAPQPGPKPRPALSPNPPNGKPAEISSPPQIYNKNGRGDPVPPQAETPPASAQAGPQPLSDNPGLAKVQQVLTRVQLLQEDVDEFVGRKTDKSYRCLEELLTKELLELDSVETQGQENVRQARKEAVQRIQAILDQLERKAF